MTFSSDYPPAMQDMIRSGPGEAEGRAAAEPGRVPAAPREPDARQPHVLLVCDNAGWERIGPIIRRLVVGLIDEAVKVTVVCDRDCPAGLDLPGLQPAVSLASPGYLDMFRPTRRFEGLLEHAQRVRPTCIHAASISSLEMALDIRQALHLPLLATVDTMEQGPLSMLADQLRRDVLAVAMSETIRRALLSCADAPDKSQFVEMIRPGVYVQDRAAAPFEPGSPVSMLVLEPATRSRRFEAVLQTVAQLLQDGINVMLFFLGTGPAEAHLRKLALRLQIHEHLTFTGKFLRWPQALGAADLVLLPQPQTRMHIYPLEAMAGATLVVAAAGHCYDTLIDDRTGVEFDPHREDDLASRLGAILKDPHQARSLAYAAQERIRRDHAVSHMIAAHRALYDRLSAIRPGGVTTA